MAVDIDIRYEGNLICTATHGPSGRTMTTDAPVDNGGKGETFSPTDLVAVALGTCIMTILGLEAKRSGLDLAGARIHVTKTMVANPIRRIGELKATVTLPAGVPKSDRARFERAGNQCPVKESLHSGVTVTVEYVWPD